MEWVGVKMLKCVSSSSRGRRKHLYLNLVDVRMKTARSAPLALLQLAPSDTVI
jgi:hypothetical protein